MTRFWPRAAITGFMWFVPMVVFSLVTSTAPRFWWISVVVTLIASAFFGVGMSFFFKRSIDARKRRQAESDEA